MARGRPSVPKGIGTGLRFRGNQISPKFSFTNAWMDTAMFKETTGKMGKKFLYGAGARLQSSIKKALGDRNHKRHTKPRPSPKPPKPREQKRGGTSPYRHHTLFEVDEQKKLVVAGIAMWPRSSAPRSRPIPRLHEKGRSGKVTIIVKKDRKKLKGKAKRAFKAKYKGVNLKRKHIQKKEISVKYKKRITMKPAMMKAKDKLSKLWTNAGKRVLRRGSY